MKMLEDGSMAMAGLAAVLSFIGELACFYLKYK